MGSRARQGIERRLAAIAAISGRKVNSRDRLRDRAKAARVIRFAAARAGIDPARIPGLDGLAYTPARLAELGLTPQLDRADAEFLAREPGRPARWDWAMGVSRRMARFQRNPPRGPDATLDDWYAWALAQSAAPAERQ